MAPRDSKEFQRIRRGAPLAVEVGMIWFLEKQESLLVCEIRRAEENESVYEFEIADATGPRTMRFESPKELIANYLEQHARLMAEGWRPRAGNVTALE
jgi:hypothetical protein